MIRWNEPLRLGSYRDAPKSPGIYIIGGAGAGLPVVGSGTPCSYTGMNFPEAMMPYYVGVSSEKRQGVRSRLSSHARGKGNKDIARRIAQSEPLWFVTAEGAEWIEYEALFLLLKTKGAQFGSNVRDELEPSSKRQRERVRASMTENDRNFYDHLDFDGRGL